MARTSPPSPSEVFRNFPEFRERLPLIAWQGTDSRLEAIVDVILDQRPLCLADRLFDSVQLLGDVKARAAPLDHLGNAAQMSLRAFQALEDLRVTGVEIGALHLSIFLSYPPGLDNTSRKRVPCY